MYSFTNHFTGPTLRQRISMMNSRRSSMLSWWRYVIWNILLGVMAFACRHASTDDEIAVTRRRSDFPLTNVTRTLAAELDQTHMPWYRQAGFLTPDRRIIMNGRPAVQTLLFNFPKILCLKNNHLSLKNTFSNQVMVFINGQQSTTAFLAALTFEEISDLLIYQKWEDQPGAEKYPETYRIFISTTHKTPEVSQARLNWKQFLLANALSNYPLGKSSRFSMNKLLEATFFHNKLAFVERTNDDHLRLYNEYATDIDLYINGLPVDKKSIESVHIREVDRLYTRERSFKEWVNELNRQHRFVLFIQTSPKRAKRDSTYYVFSPFYSGDF